MNKKSPERNKIKLIFNPNAGKKRSILAKGKKITIEDIQFLLNKYLLPVDLAPTTGPGHATTLAKNAIKEGYEMVLAAGGDGTVNEVANGLVGSDVLLGIIPLGSFMNIAHMLAIPRSIEQAIQLIKIKRTVKIDVGVLTKLEGDKLVKPYYFLETSGIGMDAKLQRHVKAWESGHYLSLLPFVKDFLHLPEYEMTITTDKETLECKANLVTIANGPVTGAALRLAPDAKLNNHVLTVVIYHMSRINTWKYFANLLLTQKVDRRRIKTLEAKKVVITTKTPVLVHADASIFGDTPVSYNIEPASLNVICGFPESAKQAGFTTRTFINP